MPEQPDDDLVPPQKVMRKRLNGVYRADTGFSGPTRRYVLIVALLVALASVPTLAAITAGSNQLADGKTDTIDIPFLPPASPGPIQSPPASVDGQANGQADGRVGGRVDGQPVPSAGTEPSTPSLPDVTPPVQGGGLPDAAERLGRLLGSAGKRRPKDAGDASTGSQTSPSSGSPSGSSNGSASGSSSGPVSSGKTSGSAKTGGGKTSGGAKTGGGKTSGSAKTGGGQTGGGQIGGGQNAKTPVKKPPAGSGNRPGRPHKPARPADPDESGHLPGRPPGDDDPADSEDSDESPDDGEDADSGEHSDGDDSEEPSNSDESDDPDEPGRPPARDDRPACHERGRCGDRESHHHRPDQSHQHRCADGSDRTPSSRHRTGRTRTVTVHIKPTGWYAARADRESHVSTEELSTRQSSTRQASRSIARHRSSDRSEDSRRSAVAERPQNVGPANVPERSYANSGYYGRRANVEARNEENQVTNWSYRGSHRAGSMHHNDDHTAAQQRSSRMGRHHAESSTGDLSNR